MIFAYICLSKFYLLSSLTIFFITKVFHGPLAQIRPAILPTWRELGFGLESTTLWLAAAVLAVLSHHALIHHAVKTSASSGKVRIPTRVKICSHKTSCWVVVSLSGWNAPEHSPNAEHIPVEMWQTCFASARNFVQRCRHLPIPKTGRTILIYNVPSLRWRAVDWLLCQYLPSKGHYQFGVNSYPSLVTLEISLNIWT